MGLKRTKTLTMKALFPFVNAKPFFRFCKGWVKVAGMTTTLTAPAVLEAKKAH
jgi:hypothetical protein